MQEEVIDRAVQLTIQTSRLTTNALKLALRKLLVDMKKGKASKYFKGKQSVKQLVRQGAGVSSIEITDDNIKSFDRVARKYGVDYALRKDSSTVPPKYLVFFKARDADALTAAFTEFSAKMMQRDADKPSVLEIMQKFKGLIKDNVLDKVKNRTKGEREL